MKLWWENRYENFLSLVFMFPGMGINLYDYASCVYSERRVYILRSQ